MWCRREDLNPRPTHYECVALPLSYVGAAGIIEVGNVIRQPSFAVLRIGEGRRSP